jgi:methionyl-tRNA formyltransferase
VTNPDEPSGRGMKMQSNIIKTLAQQLDIPDDHIYTPESLRLDSKKYADQAYHIYTSLVDLAPDYIIVIAYGKIIPQHILDIPRIAPINIHGSLLPRYRGASPIQSVFLDHEHRHHYYAYGGRIGCRRYD